MVTGLRVIADLHIHSRFSRATSKRINVREISRFAEMKGLSLVGTGDFTHPTWMEELQKDLTEVPDTQLLKPVGHPNRINFLISGEVSTIFDYKGSTKKIHHLILSPDFETAKQVNDILATYGNLEVDGRPTLTMTASHLVEEIKGVSDANEVIPAHVWTPWFSALGAFSGFDSIDECYQDMIKHIHALETGLSSDPPMNWRLSALDRFTLISNSDCHSCWPWRIGREANVFKLKRLTYDEVLRTLREKNIDSLEQTLETNPAYGKYHWTGHRNCNVSLPPSEAIKYGNQCPICRKKLTKGVEQRVEELADRPASTKPQNAAGFTHILPLSEIIAAALDASSPNLRSVWTIYNHLISELGTEYSVLLDASEEAIARASNSAIARAILRVRKGDVQTIPGYDGVYGRLLFVGEEAASSGFRTGRLPQTQLTGWSTRI